MDGVNRRPSKRRKPPNFLLTHKEKKLIAFVLIVFLIGFATKLFLNYNATLRLISTLGPTNTPTESLTTTATSNED